MSSASPIEGAQLATRAMQATKEEGRRGKNLILFSDGTGNRGGTGNSSNVWRLYRHVNIDSEDVEQRVYYHDGVGTDSNRFLKAIGGAFGYGLSGNVRALYKFLIKNYEPGDQIYLFGFSRGAFTVRSVAGLIAACGILNLQRDEKTNNPSTEESIDAAVMAAFDAYRYDHLKKLGGWWFWPRVVIYHLARKRLNPRWLCNPPKTPKEILNDKDLVYEPKPIIRCVGVWDTVSAVGAPMDWMRDLIDHLFCIRFHKHDLSPNIQHGYHALAIDDERHTFAPLLWDEVRSTKVFDDQAQEMDRWTDVEGSIDEPSVQQVWFAGAHSNVGGGYPKQGMAAVSLYWMMERVEKLGLEFDPGAMDEVKREANANDRLYDSRSGLGVYYRYRPRDIARLCEGKLIRKAKPGGGHRRDIELPWVHASVFERIRRAPEGYAPGNLPMSFDVDFRGSIAPGVEGDWDERLKEALSEEEKRAEEKRVVRGVAVEKVATAGGTFGTELYHSYRTGLLAEVRGKIKTRIWLQRGFVAVTVTGLISTYIALAQPSWPGATTVIGQVWATVKATLTGIAWMVGAIKSPIESIGEPLAAQFSAAPYVTSAGVAVVVAAYGSYFFYNQRVKTQMDLIYRKFWRRVAGEIEIRRG